MIQDQFFIGSICLSDIPKELIKAPGNGKLYLNISIGTKKNKQTNQPEADQYGKTHWISCAPKKEERLDGKNYFIGDLKLSEPVAPISPEQVEAAPVASQGETDTLPF